MPVYSNIMSIIRRQTSLQFNSCLSNFMDKLNKYDF